MKIWTIGHSTRTHDELFGMLADREITHLIDVRSYPSSKHCPQWNLREIASDAPRIARYGLNRYSHMAELGGKRKALPMTQSVNTGLHNASFRGYGDYMQTEDFAKGLERLVDIASMDRCAIMCAEAVWWRCHRSMIADALVAQGHEVVHIMGAKNQSHPVRDFVCVEDGHVTYPPEQMRLVEVS